MSDYLIEQKITVPLLLMLFQRDLSESKPTKTSHDIKLDIYIKQQILLELSFMIQYVLMVNVKFVAKKLVHLMYV